MRGIRGASNVRLRLGVRLAAAVLVGACGAGETGSLPDDTRTSPKSVQAIHEAPETQPRLPATELAIPSADPDELLRERVEKALASASDVPSGSIAVDVRNGIVTLSGSVYCQECGGRLTPAGPWSVQQSVGAIVRAVPGVRNVEFSLETSQGLRP